MTRPASDEYDEYFHRYIELVPDGSILETLRTQIEETLAPIETLEDERAGYRYEPLKWSVREVVGHCLDTEHLLGFRALWFARGQPGDLPSFDPDVCDDHATHDERSIRELCDEWRAVRASQLAMFGGFDQNTWSRRGTASGKTYSVRAMAWILGGHERHHRQVLADRYGVG
ncbi:MAG: DinB family protein [Planctomycetota bacterium]